MKNISVITVIGLFLNKKLRENLTEDVTFKTSSFQNFIKIKFSRLVYSIYEPAVKIHYNLQKTRFAMLMVNNENQ